MILAKNLCLTLGSKVIFDNVSFSFDKTSHIAFVGRNGTGKTTMLNALAGTQAIDSGEISIIKGSRIAYMPQEQVLNSDKSVIEEVLTVLGEVHFYTAEIDRLEKIFEEKGTSTSQEDLDAYAHAQEKIAEFNLATARVDAAKILMGLGFTVAQLELQVSTLSVGWKMRVVLAKLLFQKADFYLFDEPTNHLDIVAKDWFINFLKNADFGFLLISHDRFFLDNSCESTFTLDRGKARLFHGNYSYFLEEQAREKEALELAYTLQQKELKHKKELIEKFKAKASKAKMAKSMEKALDRIEVIELDSGPRSVRFSFPDVARSGEVVLKIEDVTKSFDGRTIFKNASFELKRGEKAAIVASNGKGKTTLFNVIANKLKADSGKVTFGHNVTWALFEQDQGLVLNPKKTILQEVEDACSTAESRARVRPLLGSFLFPGGDVEKKIGVLSGGEKNRVAMVKVLLQKANLLLLDEPTNHLDLQSKEILLEGLKKFPGTILFVSHDRFFLDELSTCIFALSENGIASYRGNYEEYLYQKAKADEALLPAESRSDKKSDKSKFVEQTSEKSGKDSYAGNKNLQKLEEKIARYEKELEAINQKIADVSYQLDEFDGMQKRMEELTDLLSDAYVEWSDLSKKK